MFGWDRIHQAAVNAAVSPVTWVPAAATGRGIFMRQFDGVIEEETGRTQPNGAGTTPNSTLIVRNIEYLNLSSTAAKASQIGLVDMTADTAWPRVEAKQPYPSDVLVGAALGPFFGGVITDAFIGRPVSPASITPAVELSRVGLLVSLHWPF